MSTKSISQKEMKDIFMDVVLFELEKIYSKQDDEEVDYCFKNKDYKEVYLKIDAAADGLSKNQVRLMMELIRHC